MLPSILSLSFALMSFLSCSTAQQAQSLKLPSGRVIRVLGVGRVDFPQGPAALMLKYETDLKTSDTTALRKEADEIWSVFRSDVENGAFSAAVLSANEKPAGAFLQKSSGYNFVYEKAADGRWHCLDDEKAK